MARDNHFLKSFEKIYIDHKGRYRIEPCKITQESEESQDMDEMSKLDAVIEELKKK